MNEHILQKLMNKSYVDIDKYNNRFSPEKLAALIRADEREACLNCYSPDDTATDWADKIRARGNK